MVTSTDNWFRPSDICVAPDGSVFVADWYDPGVGGHGMGDFDARPHLPPGAEGQQAERAEGGPGNARKASRRRLASPNLAVRYMAMAKIERHGPAAGGRSCLKRPSTQKDNPWLRARRCGSSAQVAAELAATSATRLRGQGPALPHPGHAQSCKEFQNQSPADYIDSMEGRPCSKDPSAQRAARGAAAGCASGPGEGQAAHPRAGQAIRRQGPLLPRSHRHRRRPTRQGPPRQSSWPTSTSSSPSGTTRSPTSSGNCGRRA